MSRVELRVGIGWEGGNSEKNVMYNIFLYLCVRDTLRRVS